MSSQIDIEFRVYVLMTLPNGCIWMPSSGPFSGLDMAESAKRAEEAERPFALFRIVQRTTIVIEEVI